MRVAGVATTSVVLGLLMYWKVPQAQDLFLEIVGHRLGGIVFWIAFYAAAILAWVVPVYVSSCWMLARYNVLADRSIEDDLIPVRPWVVRLVPPLLGTLCLVAVLLGQWQAITSAPITGFVCVESGQGNAVCPATTLLQVLGLVSQEIRPGRTPLATIRTGNNRSGDCCRCHRFAAVELSACARVGCTDQTIATVCRCADLAGRRRPDGLLADKLDELVAVQAIVPVDLGGAVGG